MSSPAGPRQKRDLPICRILLLDDHEDTLNLFQMFLRELGYHVDAARTIEEVRSICTDDEYDLLIADVRLKCGDVYEFMDEIRTKCGTRAIAMSGLCFERDRQRSLDAGFLAHLCKPVELHDLVDVVETFLAGRCSKERVA